MDEMAAVLNNFAGGMQQSFATVFDRVGQSLEQSAQMMQMMNDVMEAALLQNLQAACTFASPESALRLRLTNASQIHVAALGIAVRLDGQDADLFSTQLEALASGDECELLVPVDKHGDRWVSLSGTIRLSLQSPGTQQPLTKSVPFHAFFFEDCAFEPVVRDAMDLAKLEVVESANVTLEALRLALRLSPLDAMMTVEQGCYRVATAHRHIEFYVFITPDASLSPPFRVGVASAAASSDDALRAQCELMLRDLEVFSSQMG
jgi:hypothetical protein